MLIKSRRGWELPETAAAPETVFRDRRRLLKGLAAGGTLIAGASLLASCDEAPPPQAKKAAGTTSGPAKSALNGFQDPTIDLYPVARNERYKVDRDLTPEEYVTSYNNFYEFGSQKSIKDAAQILPIRPWDVRIDGMVEKEMTIGIDELIRKMPLEERVYRHRCVEAWSIVVPWTGFPMKAPVPAAGTWLP